jgi:competence ComEA-like helix-hairpin-helix protein
MIRPITLGVVLASLLLNSAEQSTLPKPSDDKLAVGPGEKVVERACITCHTVRIATSKRASEDEWAEEVDKMVARGAVLSDEETDLVVEYLSTHYGPDDAKDEHSTVTGTAPQASSAQPSSSNRAVPQAASGTATPSASPNTPAPINVNKVGVEELASSLGLAKTEAEAIVHYGEQHGNFKTWQEVSSVPGVPFEKIRDNQKRLVF